MENTNQDIWEYAKILLRRKWLLILPAILCMGVATFVALKLPAYYRSTTLILVEQQKISEAYVTPSDVTPFSQRLGTIQQQVMSRTNLEKIRGNFNLYPQTGKNKVNKVHRVMQSLGLTSDSEPSTLEKKVNSALKKLGLAEDMEVTKEEIIEIMRSDIKVDVIGNGRRKGGDAFRISYDSKDPYLAMQVANTIASLFIEENLRIKEQYAEGTSEFLLKELEKAKQELEVLEGTLRKFKEENLGALPGQMDANLRTLDRLQLNFQSVNEALKNAEDRKVFLEEQINLMPRQRVPAMLGTPTSETNLAPVDELEVLKNRLSVLRSVYKDTYPDVILVKNRISELEGRLTNKRPESEKPENKKETVTQDQQEQEKADAITDIKNSPLYADLAKVTSRIATLKAREGSVRNQIAEYEKRVEVTPGNEQKLGDLMRDYKITFKNYQTLLEKKLNARLAENLEKKQKGARFRIIDPANLPEKPFKPNRKNIVAFGLIIGLAIGAGFIFILEFLNPAFRKPEDFVGVLDSPVLASIPIFDETGKSQRPKKFRIIRGNKKESA